MKGRRIPIYFFGNFPSGMADEGLFLLRVITALTLGYIGHSLQDGSSAAMSAAFSIPHLLSILLPLLGLLMIFGLATTISGILSCALQLLLFGWLYPRMNSLSVIAAGLSLVLILLGPGAYSLDARFFGQRRIAILRRTSKHKS
jgi:putative oxidoreductase